MTKVMLGFFISIKFILNTNTARSLPLDFKVSIAEKTESTKLLKFLQFSINGIICLSKP